MAANIAEIRANVRKDLHDEDASAYRWIDATLDRHITRAVREYTIAAPLEQKTTIAATAGSRDLAVASLSGLITIACSAAGARAIIVYTLSGDTNIRFIESTDSGQTFGTETSIATASTAVADLAVAYKDNTGTAVVTWVESGRLSASQRSGTGAFGGAVQHPTPTNSLSGVATAFVFDWNVVLTGIEATTLRPTVWTTTFGDGVDQTAGTWAPLVVQQQAEQDAQVTYRAPSLAYTDQYHMRFVEADAFTGGATRTWRSALITSLFWPAGPFAWRTPAPVNYSGSEGLALAAGANYAYESAPDLVLSAPRQLLSQQLTGRVIQADITEAAGGPTSGAIHGAIDIDNSDGALAGPPAPIQLGNLVKVSWGYLVNGAGVTSTMADLQIARIGYRRTGGVSVLRLELTGGWAQLARDRQRTAIFHAAGANTYQTILTRLFARAGLALSTSGASARTATITPAFQIAPETSALTALHRALNFLSDRVTMDSGSSARITEPLATQPSAYTFGIDHPIYEAEIAQVVTPASQTAAVGQGAYGEAIDFTNAQAYIGTRELIRDLTSTTGAQAAATAAAHLRQSQLDQPGGRLVAPPSCGLQPLDVIDISDPLVQPAPILRRVQQIRWRYDQASGTYEQQLTLGAV
ncbi:MAG: hypothetical protein IVW36_11200 [Dehalococcoidia bacterium]|nr:hypothetical protein [Dehalococcoidia bacterium]